MKKEDKEFITELMGVEPIRINSSLVSAQLRDRLYWTIDVIAHIFKNLPVDVSTIETYEG